MEILNLVQYTANDMDTAELKREFGADLTFWGGGIETQKTLPTGSVQDVIDETKKQLDILMPGGGFVFARSTPSSGARRSRTSSPCGTPSVSTASTVRLRRG